MSDNQPAEPRPGTGADGPHARRPGIELAREALAQAKADARRRGETVGSGESARRGRRGRPRSVRDGGDPLPLRAAIDNLLSDRGWQEQAAAGSVFGRWAEIVGPELAEHTTPGTFDEGELVVAADSTAWATQVRLLAGNLVRRLNEELGDGTVRRVKVQGPSVPGWRKGPLRAPGSRGPRDTYG